MTGDSEKYPNSNKIKKIYGYFQQVNPISDKLVQYFYSVGVTKQELEPYTNPPKVIPGRSNLKSQEEFEEQRFKDMERLHGKKVEEKSGADVLADLDIDF